MSTRDRLDLERFEQLLAVHGGRLERWPQAQREPLRRLLDASAQARARWAEAAELDALLAAAPEIEPTSELVARLASLPARHPRPERPGWWPFGNPLAPLLAWGAAAALGVALGMAGVDGPDADVSDVAVGDGASAAWDVAVLGEEAAEDDAAADEWSELAGLAMGATWALEDE